MSVIEFDLDEIRSIQQLHKLLAQKLNFPDWYGKNWDAFWDAITGLVEMPENTIFYKWELFRERFPKDAGVLFQTIQDYNAQAVGSQIVVV